ncbi:hypothetical protein [Homoserinibacter sp. GY 40078]|nr:hypothetical protein [Homoserinibacter sp. GY 40078]
MAMHTDEGSGFEGARSADIFGDFGMRWSEFGEYEVPFDPFAALDGD